MENQQLTCATKFGYNNVSMCEHCSSAQFDQGGNIYWKCNKYNKPLKDNEDKFLLKCKECLDNN